MEKTKKQVLFFIFITAFTRKSVYCLGSNQALRHFIISQYFVKGFYGRFPDKGTAKGL